LKRYEYKLENLSCAHCAARIEKALSINQDLRNVSLNFNTTKLSFESDKKMDMKKYVEETSKKIEQSIEVLEINEQKKSTNNYIPIIRLAVGVILAVIGIAIDFMPILIVAGIILLYRTAKLAYTKVFKNKILDENTLIIISVVGAFLVAQPSEGLMVIALYEIGKILEDRAVNKTRKSIAELMNIKPEYANLETMNEVKKVDPKEVKVSEIIIVKTGEKVPLDGMVISGNASLDLSALTGESKLVELKEGDTVLSGSVNIEGILKIKVTKIYRESTVAKILELVENATDRKAKTETFVSKAAKIYTPTVLILAILVATLMPLVISGITYNESIYRALIFLVISCPCAMAISVPLSYFSGIGRASKAGILVKGSDYLDNIRNIKTMIFDKTGTLTTGSFNISKIESLNENYSEDDVLKIAAYGESFSNHPIAKSILKKYNNEIPANIENYKEIAGKGITYKYENDEYLIGNAELLNTTNSDEGTIIYVGKNNELIGKIIIKDEIKPHVKEVMNELSKMKINIKMFTGDNQTVAERVGNEVNIKDINYELLPDEKYKKLEEILNSRENKEEKVAFIGDGINDSPVLALADVGISMGGVGSSSAIEASDVVIMTDEINKVLEAIIISKSTNIIIKQNLIFAIGTKLLFLSLSVLGLTGMWQAIFADVGVTLLTILNSIRILKLK